jgi:hypothetical protein
VLIQVAIEEPTELLSLYHWLRLDDDVASNATVTSQATTDSGTMSALEIINVVLSQASGYTGLALAILAWRRSQSTHSAITLKRPDGQVLTISGSPEVTSDLIVRFLAMDTSAADSGRSAGSAE